MLAEGRAVSVEDGLALAEGRAASAEGRVVSVEDGLVLAENGPALFEAEDELASRRAR